MSPASLPAAAPPLEDDDLLSEILLRLPPDPSSLPRARAVSRRWRSLAADPRFCARFRAHHRRNPPLLGCFAVEHFHSISHQPILREARFCPVLEAPNRVPEGCITFPIACDHLMILGCRHGLVLTLHRWRGQPMVWDPLTGDQRRLDTPPGFDRKHPISGAVLRAAGDDFQVVLVGRCDSQRARAIASVYSSKTGAWGNLVSTPLPVDDRYGDSVLHPGFFMPAVMVGNSLYWLFVGGRNPAVIVEFDLDSWSLALMPTPVEKFYSAWRPTHIWVIPAQGGGLGFLVLSGFSAQFWKRKKDCDGGVASWVLGRTIALDKLLPINLGKEIEHLWIIGLAEDNNTVLLKSSIGVFTLHLESLEPKKIFESNYRSPCSFPFEGVYTADKGIDGGHDGPELLQNV